MYFLAFGLPFNFTSVPSVFLGVDFGVVWGLDFGLDFTPFPNVHLMPNLYLNTYKCALSAKDYGQNPKASGVIGTDAAYRFTIYYIFGKKEGVRF